MTLHEIEIYVFKHGVFSGVQSASGVFMNVRKV